MLKWLHDKCFQFSEQENIIDCIGKYISVEKMAFLSMPNICFHEAQISWTIFLSQFPGNFFDYNNILFTMKKDAVFNLSTFQ